VILSVLLGSHPPVLPVRSLVRTAELFGISEGTTRVALSRLAAEGDVTADETGYHLSGRLVSRQVRQDESRHPPTRPWRGGWELAIGAAGSAADRAALAAELVPLRLAELSAGVWTRPDNLRRSWPGELSPQVWRFEGRLGSGPDASAAELAARLWDLTGWAERAERLIAALGARPDPAQRFMVAAAMVRHLQDDPVLPPALLPAGWPGARLRKAYAGYERELAGLLQQERARHG
jgi:phenylacetic acid degradation operon negative regulatory protein